MNVRSVWNMMNGSEQNAEVPAEIDRPEALAVEPEGPAETGEAERVTATTETNETKAASQRAFTSRSRKSIQKEQALEKELATRKALKGHAQNALAGLAVEKGKFLKLVTTGEVWADTGLSRTLEKIEAEIRKLALFTEEAAKAELALSNYRAYVAAFAPQRAEIQGNLAQLAAARLEVDRELERLLREALAMLKVREEAVSSMRRQAGAIELTGSFEAGVPASLHEALSLEIVSASEAWNARFLGQEEHLKAYVVSADPFEPEIETLTRRAVYQFGETVYLLEEEAAEFLRNDRPKPNGRGWECLPPALMTAEAFAAAQAESGRAGPILRYVLQQRHDELEQRRFEAYKLERRGTPVPGVHLGGR